MITCQWGDSLTFPGGTAEASGEMQREAGKENRKLGIAVLRKGICLHICLAFLQKDSAGSCTGNSGLRAGAACVDTGQVVCVANEIFWSKYMLQVDITCVPFVSSF